MIGRVDPEIENLLVELNKHGFKTVESCAGHGEGSKIGFNLNNVSVQTIKTGDTHIVWLSVESDSHCRPTEERERP